MMIGIKKVKAVVLENNGNMVRVEIKDYGTKKKRVIKKLKRESPRLFFQGLER